MRANGVRMLANFADGKAPGTESSIEKIFWSEFDKRFRETALDLLGPGGQLLRSSPGARRDVDWAREFLWSRAGTIYSGSSEVQRNIIAKRVLGLPQDLSRCDSSSPKTRQLLRSSTRDFFTKAAPLEHSRRVMEHEPRGFETPQWRQLAEMGYLGLVVPGGARRPGARRRSSSPIVARGGRPRLPARSAARRGARRRAARAPPAGRTTLLARCAPGTSW